MSIYNQEILNLQQEENKIEQIDESQKRNESQPAKASGEGMSYKEFRISQIGEEAYLEEEQKKQEERTFQKSIFQLRQEEKQLKTLKKEDKEIKFRKVYNQEERQRYYEEKKKEQALAKEQEEAKVMTSRDERQERFIKNRNKETITADQKLQATQDIIITKDRNAAIVARKEYNERHRKVEAIPLEALSNGSNSLSDQERIRYYAKYHKCTHGYGYNIIRGKHVKRFLCDHIDCVIEEDFKEYGNLRCYVCGWSKLKSCVNKKCLCESHICERCKRHTYAYYYGTPIQYLSKFPEKPVFQSYDKHSYGGPIISLEKKTMYDSQYFKDYITKYQYKPLNIIPRKLFMTLMREGRLDEMEKIQEEWKKTVFSYSRIVEKKTVSQGGAISTVSDSIGAAASGILDKLASLRDKIVGYLTRTTEKISGIGKDWYIVKKMKSLLKSLKYFIRVIFDYTSVLDPLTIYELYKDGFGVTNIFRVAKILFDAKSKEELSKFKLFFYASMGSPDSVPRAILEKIVRREIDLGVLHSQIVELICTAQYKNFPELFAMVDKLGFVGNELSPEIVENFKQKNENQQIPHISGVKDSQKFDWRWEEANTESQAGWHCFESFLRALKGVPKYFTESITPLAKFFKDILPLMSGLKLTSDLFGIAKKIVNSLLGTFFGNYSKFEDWLSYHIHSEDNPIHELVALYMVYTRHTCLQSTSQREQDIVDTRTAFYCKLSECDKFVQDSQQFGPKWISFKNGLEQGFSKPPAPSARKDEPFVLAISGSAGVGKSTTWKMLTAHLFAKDPVFKNGMNLENFEKLIYTFTDTEFETGACDKKIYLFDDFGQKRTAEPMDIPRIISLATSAPYFPNIASIAGKEIKGMQMNPDLVVALSNVKDFRTLADQLADRDALIRRFDLQLEMLERYDSENPDQQLYRVLMCHKYSDLEKTVLTMAQARALITALYLAKKDESAQVRAMQEKSMEMNAKMFQNISKPFTKSNIAAATSVFKDNKDVCALLEKYVFPQAGTCETFLQMAKRCLIEGFFENLDGISMLAFTLGYTTAITYDVVMDANAKISGLPRDRVPAEKKWFILKNILIDQSKALLAVAVSIVTLVAGLKMYRSWYGHDDQSGTTRTAESKSREITTVPEKKSVRQSGGDVSLFYNATGTVRNVENGQQLNCIFVGGQHVLIPRHLFVNRVEGGYVTNNTVFGIKKTTWEKEKFFSFNAKRLVHFPSIHSGSNEVHREDMVLYLLPKETFNAEKNIVKHFWDGDFDCTNFPVDMVDYRPNETPSLVICSGVVTNDQIMSRRVDGTDNYFHVFAEATYKNRPMACGNPIITSINGTTKIIGGHTAASFSGHGNYSYFNIVSRPMLEQAMKQSVDVEILYVDVIAQDGIPKGPRHILDGSNLEYIGPLKTAQHVTAKTQLSKSDAYEMIQPHITEPAVLKWDDIRVDPGFADSRHEFYARLFASYKLELKEFPVHELEWASETMIADMHKIGKESMVKSKVLNFDEALNGLSYIPGNTAMDMTTSMGYPYTTKQMKKVDYFYRNYDNKLSCSNKKIEEDYDDAMWKIKHGVVPCLPFALTLKDERLKIAKIKQPRTRIFSCGNITHFLVMRSYFYTTLMQIYHTKLENNFCYPSLDRISLDWHLLSSHMLEVGDKGFDFDFTNWDKTIQRPMMYYGVQVLLATMSITDIERETLTELICGPFMVFENSMFRSNGILMSGSLITYALNCVVNEMIHRVAWRVIMKENKPQIAEIRYYKKFTRGIRGGDDTITTVSDKVIGIFNGVTVSKVLLQRGLLVTSSDKTSQIKEWSKYMDLIFLKNRTQVLQGYYAPLPFKDDLIESTNWVRLSPTFNDRRSATLSNICCALRGLFFLGKETYDACYNKWKVLGSLPSYRETADIWNTFYRFPGEHSDYATRTAQDLDIVEQAQPHSLISARNNRVLHSMEKLEIKQTQYQSRETKPIEIPSKLVEDNDKEKEALEELRRFGFGPVQINTDLIGYNLEAKLDGPWKPIGFCPKPKELGTLGTPIKLNCFTKRDTEPQSGNGEYGVWDSRNLEAKMLGEDKAAEAQAMFVTPEVTPSSATTAASVTMEGLESDTSDKTQVKSVGVTVQGNDKNTSMPVRVGTKIVRSLDPNANKYCNDINWTLEDLLKKYTYVGDVNWSVTDSAYSVLKSYRVPEDFITTAAQKGPFDVTRLSRFAYISVLVVQRGSNFYEGATLMAFYPFGVAPDWRRGINMGGLIHKVSTEQLIEYKIPFRYPKYHLQVPTDSLGEFIIHVLSPLSTAAGNASDIPLSVYVSFEGCEFKIPDIVPDSIYRSKKFAVKNTRPQSGTSTQEKAVYCDINDTPDKMPKVKLCAGTGLVGKPYSLHFQDQPLDLVEMCKRTAFVGYMDMVSNNSKTTVYSIPAQVLYDMAFRGLQRMFAMSRADIVVKIVALKNDGVEMYCKYGVRGDFSLETMIDGHQIFSYDTPAMAVIPWTQRTFAVDTAHAIVPMEGNLYLYRGPGNSSEDETVRVAIYVCVGDGASMGVYLGCPDKIFIKPSAFIQNLGEFNFPVLVPTVTRKNVVVKKTRPQSGIVNMIDDVVKTALPIAKDLGELSNLLDAPAVTEQPALVMPRKYPYMVPVDLMNYAERMLTVTHNGVTRSDPFIYGVSRKETGIYELLTETKSFYDAVPWTQTQGVGEVIFDDWVQPNGLVGFEGALHDILPHYFNFWHGSIIYIFDVVATGHHRGQLKIAYTPNSIADFTYEDATQTYFTTLDLSSGHATMAVEVPYLSEFPYRNTKTTSEGADIAAGRLKVFIQNPLRSSTTVPANVEVMIYKSCGKDFKLGIFGANNADTA